MSGNNYTYNGAPEDLERSPSLPSSSDSSLDSDVVNSPLDTTSSERVEENPEPNIQEDQQKQLLRYTRAYYGIMKLVAGLTINRLWQVDFTINCIRESVDKKPHLDVYLKSVPQIYLPNPFVTTVPSRYQESSIKEVVDKYLDQVRIQYKQSALRRAAYLSLSEEDIIFELRHHAEERNHHYLNSYRDLDDIYGDYLNDHQGDGSNGRRTYTRRQERTFSEQIRRTDWAPLE